MINIKEQRGIIYFSAPWCEPCKTFGPVIEGLIKEGYNVRKVNIDYDATLPKQYGIQSVPTLVLTTMDGSEIKRTQQKRDRSSIIQWFESN